MISVVLLMASASADTFMIRNGISFGMSREEVIKTETLKDYGGNSSFIKYVDAELAGYSRSILEYKFESGKLKTVYMVFNNGAKRAQCEREYKELNNVLVEKYGKPLEKKNGKPNEPIGTDLQDAIDVTKQMSNYAVTFSEWLINDDGGKVKIEHYVFTDKNDVNNVHMIVYTYHKDVSNADRKRDI